MNRKPLSKFCLIVFLAFGFAMPSRVAAGSVFNAGLPADVIPSGAIRFVPVALNGRTLTGPNSTARLRNGRIMIPIAIVANALGDTVRVDVTARTVTVRRQTGIISDFDAGQGRVRENNSLVLMVSNVGEVIFSPRADELFLPVEIVSALFDLAIRFDAARNVVSITRGMVPPDAGTQRKGRRTAEIYRADYEYNLNRYGSGGSQDLMLTAAGRLADGRFNFTSNSSSSPHHGLSLRNANFNLERPNGQRFVAGDFGTGADLQFLSTMVRGGSVSVPFGDTFVTAFGGRTYSGVVVPSVEPVPQSTPVALFRDRSLYDSNTYGVFATTNDPARRRRQKPLTFSAGAMRFNGSKRSGELVSGALNYDVSNLRIQGDVAFGSFAVSRPDNSRFHGTGAAIDIAGTFQATDTLAVQGRFAHIGANFLSPQSGVREPVDLRAAGVTWSPRKWFSALFNASTAHRPVSPAGPVGIAQNDKFLTAAFSITPGAGMPRLFISHTQSSTSQVRSAAFTMLNASKDFSRVQLFLNATRIAGAGPAAMNVQLNANYAMSDRNSLEVSQGLGSRHSMNGQFAWRTSDLLDHRLSLTGGIGYNHSQTGGFSAFERFSASAKLPRETSLQVSYIQTNAGPTMMISLRGSLFRKHEGRAFLDSPTSEMNSFGKVAGRVYQDVDLNGRFDAGVDVPQADVKVRVDGNRYVETDKEGIYRFASVTAGGHSVYLDLLSVRADLTLLGGGARETTILPGSDTVFDFRLVRTGRISGRVWLDTNKNGKFDEGETLLADIRVTTGSGRDTLTDADGCFILSDLPPGEHVVLLDEKTLPEKTTAGSAPSAVQVFAGRETADVGLSAIGIPAEVKIFGMKTNK